MLEGPAVGQVITFIDDISSVIPSQRAIDDIYNNFVGMYDTEMKRKLPVIKTSKRDI